MEPPNDAGMLSPYRVLDLTHEWCLLGGKILADLGADVIQIEPPSGHPARRMGPYYKNEVHPERSLFWWSYTANKRSITLDFTTPDGQSLLKRLATSTDFLIESGPPGELASFGLGYDELTAINPQLIMVSVTPFGQSGPYANYKATDITGMGLSGFMYVTGDPDRAPVHVGFPHFFLHGAGTGASGAMMAHMHRVISGKGQYVDVSCQEATARALANAPQSYALEGSIITRQGAYRQTGGNTFMRLTWPCKDGYVNFQFSGGSGAGQGVNSMIEWMEESGYGDPYLSSLDFTQLGYGMIGPEMLERVVPPMETFIMSRTKNELFEEAVKRRILLFPVSTPQDVMDNPQLMARNYYQQVTHPDLNEPVTFLGPFMGTTAHPITHRRFPPKLGEHNSEVYGEELGLQPNEMARLRHAGII